jgi:hypothetical protein
MRRRERELLELFRQRHEPGVDGATPEAQP